MVLSTQLSRSECFHTAALLTEWFRCLRAPWVLWSSPPDGQLIDCGKDWNVVNLILFQWEWQKKSFLSGIKRKEDAAFSGRSGGLVDGVLQVPALCFQLSLLGKEASSCNRNLINWLTRLALFKPIKVSLWRVGAHHRSRFLQIAFFYSNTLTPCVSSSQPAPKSATD